MAIKTKAWTTGTGNATIQYGGQGDGQITVTSDANDLHIQRSMQIKVKTTDGSDIEKTFTISQAMKPYIDISNAVVTASNQTYNGSAKTPAPTVTLNGTTIPSSGYDVVYSNNTNAGTATITVTGKGDYTGTATGIFIIDKAAPSYTAPARRTGLTYNGSSQYLTTSGSTSDGTVYYSTDGINWYTSRRTGTNAGTYYNYWKLVGDSNHTDINPTQLNDTIIAKASRSMYWNSYPNQLYVGQGLGIDAYPSAGSSDGTLVIQTSNSNIAYYYNGLLYGAGAGSCTVTAYITEGDNYLAAQALYTVYVLENEEVYSESLSSYSHNPDYKSLFSTIGTLVPGNRYNLNITGPNIYVTNIEFLNSSGGYQALATWSNDEDFTVPSDIASWADLSMTRLAIYYSSNADAVNAQSYGDVTIALYH